MTAKQNSRLIRLPQVTKKVNVGKSTIYKWIKEEGFPKPENMGVRNSIWTEKSIDDWLDSKLSISYNGESLLRLPQVAGKVCFGKSKIYDLIKDEKFPPPEKLGSRISLWPESTIDNWIESQISNSKGAQE